MPGLHKVKVRVICHRLGRTLASQMFNTNATPVPIRTLLGLNYIITMQRQFKGSKLKLQKNIRPPLLQGAF